MARIPALAALSPQSSLAVYFAEKNNLWPTVLNKRNKAKLDAYKFMVRTSESLHARLVQEAAEEGVSVPTGEPATRSRLA